MRSVAIMPIKMNNERLPGKNIKLLGSKPLLQYELTNLLQIDEISKIVVYCSSEEIIPYLPKGIEFVKRPSYLDMPTSNFSQIFDEFIKVEDADVYIYAHATAPFVSKETMKECLDAVLNLGYDSAFCATAIQDFLWMNGKPLNFDAADLPRSQDLPIVYRESSGIYVLKKEVFLRFHRRIGVNPYIKLVDWKEAVDINDYTDFEMAQKYVENLL